MAIRGPERGGPQAPPKPIPPALPPLAQALLASGLAKTPAEARSLARTLIASLSRGGFAPPSTGTPEAQLERALKSFQEAQGLPATGRFDEATQKALQDAGHLPQARPAEGPAAPRPAAGDQKGWQDFSGRKEGAPAPTPTGGAPGQKTRGVETEQAKARVQFASPEKLEDMGALLDRLAGAGFLATGKGTEKLRETLRRFQGAENLPRTGQLDPRTADALVKQGLLQEPPARLHEEARGRPQDATTAQAPAHDASARGIPAEARSEAVERARQDDPGAQHDPTGRGVPEGAGEPTAREGRGEGPGSGKGAHGKGDEASPGEPTPGQGSLDQGDHLGTEDDDNNALAGDEDRADERRGHANLDDGEAREEGYWKVQAVSLQLELALQQIARDDDGQGAATYCWDLTLHRPGVHGAGQPAEAILHLVVEKAGAFDPVWSEARRALNAKLERFEPEAPRLSEGDLTNALRRARVRSRPGT